MAELLIKLADLYNIAIIIRAVMSWFSPDPYNPVYRFLVRITEPVLAPIRSILPATGIDFSPFIAIFLIQMLIRLMIRVLLIA